MKTETSNPLTGILAEIFQMNDGNIKAKLHFLSHCSRSPGNKSPEQLR